MPSVHIGLVGDRSDEVAAHRAIPLSLEMDSAACNVQINVSWIGADRISDGAALSGMDGIWCVPAGPYRDIEGALAGIRSAREEPLPFLGTCGGFQHAIIDDARNDLGWPNAEHAEAAPDAERQVILPLLCPLVEVTDAVHLVEGALLARAYGRTSVFERYHCSDGMAPRFREAIEGSTLRVSAIDDAGDIRGVERQGHPFFVATLFQHERSASDGQLPPPGRAFVQAILQTR